MNHYIVTLIFEVGHTRQIVVQAYSRQHAEDRVWIEYHGAGIKTVEVSEFVQYLGVDFLG